MSFLPLYHREESSPCLEQKALQNNSHAGLLFDKFCNTWPFVRENEWKMDGDSKPNWKLEWINHFTKQPVGERQVLRESVERLMRLIDKRHGRGKIFKSKYHFVTGLGRSHPVENGFTWHPVLGTPYLPGSSIKGLVRSWAENKELGPICDKETLERLLGDPRKAGGICFLDAIPTKPVTLKADVMTPHYAEWDKKKPPGDWCSPKPIPFLAMEKETSLLFGIIPHGVVEDDDLDKAMNYLEAALDKSGSGAKTAVGYGRFDYSKEETDEWHLRLDDEREKMEAKESPEARWRLELKRMSEEDILDLVRKYLEKGSLSTDDVERRAFVKVVLSDYKQWVDEWKCGKRHDPKTKTGSPKLKKRAQLLNAEAKAFGLSAQLRF